MTMMVQKSKYTFFRNLCTENSNTKPGMLRHGKRKLLVKDKQEITSQMIYHRGGEPEQAMHC